MAQVDGQLLQRGQERQAAQEKEENINQQTEVPELQSQLKKNQYAMKEEFKEFASSLKIPQFSLPVKLPPQFNFDNIDLEKTDISGKNNIAITKVEKYIIGYLDWRETDEKET